MAARRYNHNSQTFLFFIIYSERIFGIKYRSVDISYYDRLDSINKSLDIAVKIDFTSVKSCTKSSMHTPYCLSEPFGNASISTNKEARIVVNNIFVLFHK